MITLENPPVLRPETLFTETRVGFGQWTLHCCFVFWTLKSELDPICEVGYPWTDQDLNGATTMTIKTMTLNPFLGQGPDTIPLLLINTITLEVGIEVVVVVVEEDLVIEVVEGLVIEVVAVEDLVIEAVAEEDLVIEVGVVEWE